jgi:hypothetical protein
LWLKKSKILIIGDIHIGYEEALNKSGIFVPRTFFKETEKELKELLEKLKPKTVIVNGDLKHEFQEISEQEWREILKILDLILEKSDVILIRGNHDNFLEHVAKKRGLKMMDMYETGDLCITHGDKIIETKAKTLIIGHEHATLSLHEGIKVEKYKCFLLGKFKGKKLIVMPSFLPIIGGPDLMKDDLLSPYLQVNIGNFEVFVVGDKTYKFGKLKKLTSF